MTTTDVTITETVMDSHSINWDALPGSVDGARADGKPVIWVAEDLFPQPEAAADRKPVIWVAEDLFHQPEARADGKPVIWVAEDLVRPTPAESAKGKSWTAAQMMRFWGTPGYRSAERQATAR